MNGDSESSAKSEPKTALILPVFSEDGTYHPGQFSGPHTGGAHWLGHDLFFQSLLGEIPQTETYNGEELSEILAEGENAIICSRICGSVANAIGEFAGRFNLEGPPSTQDVVNDYISQCHSRICAVSNWSQQLHLGPDSSCYRFESSAGCTDANQLSVLVRAVPVQAGGTHVPTDLALASHPDLDLASKDRQVIRIMSLSTYAPGHQQVINRPNIRVGTEQELSML